MPECLLIEPTETESKTTLDGLKAAYRHEDAFRQESLLAFFLTPDNLARALMVGGVLLVLVVELINSAIEATVDHITLQDHVLAKRAKDIGNASVLMARWSTSR